MASLRQRGNCGKTVKRLRRRYEPVTREVAGPPVHVALQTSSSVACRLIWWDTVFRPLRRLIRALPMASQTTASRLHFPRTTNTIQYAVAYSPLSVETFTSGVAEKSRSKAPA
jgi:hypothetical protein